MMLPRLILSLLLALSLVLTGGTMAVMRGQMAQTTSMVICTGHGPVLMLFDADGNPVESQHPCPDCTLTLAVTDWSGPDLPQQPLTWAPMRPPVAMPEPVATAWIAVLARGPPLV